VDTILTNNKDSYNKSITEYLVFKNFMKKFLITFLTLFLFSCGNNSPRNPKNPQMENEKTRNIQILNETHIKRLFKYIS
jgi:hypothetical protein